MLGQKEHRRLAWPLLLTLSHQLPNNSSFGFQTQQTMAGTYLFFVNLSVHSNYYEDEEEEPGEAEQVTRLQGHYTR